MRDPNTPVNNQSEQDNGIGIVILVEDRWTDFPARGMRKKLSAETGFPIVKRGLNDAQVKSNKSSSKIKKAHIKAQKTSKQNVKGDSALLMLKTIANGSWFILQKVLPLRLSNEPSWGDIRVDFIQPRFIIESNMAGWAQWSDS